MIVSLLVFVVILALSIPSAVIFIPLAALTGDVRPLYTAVCFIVRTGYFVAGIRIRVEGRENVPAGRACIFMANHVSNLDPPALISHLPGYTSAFAKRAIFKIPVFGYCMKLGNFIPVDRTGSAATAQESVAAAGRMLKKGIHITTFVEGTRSKDGRMLRRSIPATIKRAKSCRRPCGRPSPRGCRSGCGVKLPAAGSILRRLVPRRRPRRQNPLRNSQSDASLPRGHKKRRPLRSRSVEGRW